MAMGRLGRILNRPGWVGRLWRKIYDSGYACLKAAVALGITPLFRPRLVGPAPPMGRGGVILCPNHESYLDPAFVQIVTRRRVTFVMTNDFYRHRLMRWFFALVGAIPVDGGRLARKGLRRAIAFVRSNHVIGIFPEGRLSRDGTRSRGQRGIAVLARRTGAPVIPMGIVGSRRAWPAGSRRPHRARVRVAFGTPMRWPAEVTHPTRDQERAFADEVMARVERVIQRIEADPEPRLP